MSLSAGLFNRFLLTFVVDVEWVLCKVKSLDVVTNVQEFSTSCRFSVNLSYCCCSMELLGAGEIGSSTMGLWVSSFGMFWFVWSSVA